LTTQASHRATDSDQGQAKVPNVAAIVRPVEDGPEKQHP
jgi:hypothetical protein